MPPDALQLQLPLPQPQPGSERQATLGDRLCDLLARRGRPLEVGHVVAQVLRMRRCPEALQRRLVAEIVESDQRLTWRGRDLVGLAPVGWAATPLAEATFCVVDIETTGGAPGRSKITEIGAARVRGGQIVDRFTTLVDPGKPIPAPIVRITGITNELLVGQPRIEEALERFVDFVRDDVMVAHNAPFDFRFLNYERYRIAGRYFTQPWLDTLVLARRLLKRRLDRFDLGTLAAWADTAVRPSHRALPDAEATAELLVLFLEMLAERGYGTLDRAVSFGQGGGARYAHKLALAEDLPQRPGVYLMRDRDGAVLYVGKARNLRRRVRSYFGPQGRHGRLIARALEGVARIDHEETGTELGALLREARLLRELKPPCNSRGVRGGAPRYLKLTAGEAYPRLIVVGEVLGDGASYYGPIRSERVARAALEMIHVLYPIRTCHALCAGGAQERLLEVAGRRCDGPCGGADPEAYRREVEGIKALLEADQGVAVGLLMERLADHATREPEMASEERREALEALISVLATLSRVRAASAATGVIVEAGPERCRAVFVANGRVVHSVDVDEAEAPELDGGVLAMQAECEREPERLRGGDLEEALILLEWLRNRAETPGVAALRRGAGGDVIAATVRRAVASVTGARARAEADDQALPEAA